jgi:hypothetical protein
VLEGSFEDLSTKVLGGSYRIQVEAKPDGIERVLRAVPGVVRVTTPRPGLYHLEAQHDCRSEVAKRVVAEGGQLLELRFDRASLDEVYARYFQEARSEA